MSVETTRMSVASLTAAARPSCRPVRPVGMVMVSFPGCRLAASRRRAIALSAWHRGPGLTPSVGEAPIDCQRRGCQLGMKVVRVRCRVHGCPKSAAPVTLQARDRGTSNTCLIIGARIVHAVLNDRKVLSSALAAEGVARQRRAGAVLFVAGQVGGPDLACVRVPAHPGAHSVQRAHELGYRAAVLDGPQGRRENTRAPRERPVARSALEARPPGASVAHPSS